MSVSVIVLHYGSQQLTKQCLESLERHSPDVEVILVDNAGDWDTDDPRWHGVGSENLGFAAGCNFGAMCAEGDTLVFLNNDTRVREFWLEHLVYELDVPNVGAAGPMLLKPDHDRMLRIQSAGISINWMNPLGEEAVDRKVLVETPHDVPAVTGACLAIRADVFNEVGGFDTGYWNGYEDVDLCLKLREAGYRIVCTPHSQVVHYESQSDPAERFKCVRENVLRLRGRWDPAWHTLTPPT